MLNKKGSQIDIAILDFLKAFDTVPYDGLLSKLKHYGIDDKIWLWIYKKKLNRKQSVVVDGKQLIKPYRGGFWCTTRHSIRTSLILTSY